LQSIYPLGAIFVLIVVFMPEGLAPVSAARAKRGR
jgi:ABC-type branched-subunit amino acid transport system permease subunit